MVTTSHMMLRHCQTRMKRVRARRVTSRKRSRTPLMRLPRFPVACHRTPVQGCKRMMTRRQEPRIPLRVVGSYGTAAAAVVVAVVVALATQQEWRSMLALALMVDAVLA
eukprot:5166973-Amphidinium_carterae.1